MHAAGLNQQEDLPCNDANAEKLPYQNKDFEVYRQRRSRLSISHREMPVLPVRYRRAEICRPGTDEHAMRFLTGLVLKSTAVVRAEWLVCTNGVERNQYPAHCRQRVFDELHS